MKTTSLATMDDYIRLQPAQVQEILHLIRTKVKAAIPDASEVMSYGLPTYRLNGKNMMHFGAFAQHIGVYATPDGHQQFEAELNQYKRGKGSVQFPINQPIPYDLIVRMAVFRAQQLTKAVA